MHAIHAFIFLPCYTKYFEVNLIKQVPAQAGLGGGSGNAATAMFGVNELLGRPASEEQVKTTKQNIENYIIKNH